jgi:queuine tRNA-ribosyltransferase
MLLTWHNLTYYQDLMQDMRQAIGEGRFLEFSRLFAETQSLGDLPHWKE